MTRALKKVKKHAGKLTAGLPRRLVSLLLTAVLLIGLVPAFELTAHAYTETDYGDYKVYWEGERGHGWVEIVCEYCGEDFHREFFGGDHEGTYSAMLVDDFPYTNCFHCGCCGPDEHCRLCGLCFEEDVDYCSECNTDLCIDCHEAWHFCDICGQCKLIFSDDFTTVLNESYKAHALDADVNLSLCEDCATDTEVCKICGEGILSFGGGAYVVADELGEDWCETCGICRNCFLDTSVLEDAGHCPLCGACPQDEDICKECGLCPECQDHCPECDICIDTENVAMCTGGGEHCENDEKDNDWICEQCGDCMEAYGLDRCYYCELCESCCLENCEMADCVHDICIESPEYADHLCLGCDMCPRDLECEYCGLCEDCVDGYHCEHEICPDNDDEWDEHVCYSCGECFEEGELCDYCHLCEDCNEHCDKHDYCPEDSDYDDHFCEECGECFETDEFCDSCGLCEECCRANTESMGCDHEICIESFDFQDHYCFEDEQCLEYCEHDEDCEHENVSTVWYKNAASHWRKCLDCGLTLSCAAHKAGAAVTLQEPDSMTRTNGKAKIPCAICGVTMGTESIPYVEIKKDGSPYIASQPKDYEGYVSDIGYNNSPRYATFRMTAGGTDLKYQWYVTGAASGKLTDKIGDIDYYKISGKPEVNGANTDTLTVLVPCDSCYENYSYYCVVTNSKGSVKTREAHLASQHWFTVFRSLDDNSHILTCAGDGCEEHQGKAKKHRFGEWELERPASSSQEGLKVQKCMDCSAGNTQTIPRIPEDHVHKFTLYAKNSNGHWMECICGVKESGNIRPHNMGGWVTEREPTERAEGIKRNTCYDCGYSVTQDIDKLPHTHNYTDLKKPKQYRFALPNGKTDENYHYTFCSGYNCTACHKEPHSFGGWQLMYRPQTGADGKLRPGKLIRYCYDCKREQTKEFTENGKYPIWAEAWDGSGMTDLGGANIEGTVVADPGEKVTLTIENISEGFVFSEWSLNEVTSSDGMVVDGTWCAYKNSDIKDLRVAADGTATFTMPNGPVGIMALVVKCDHKGQSTYRDTIDATCTGYGAEVDRCSKCRAVVNEISRTDAVGHDWQRKSIEQIGDCDTRDLYNVECTRCGKTDIKPGETRHKLYSMNNAVSASCFKRGQNTDMQCSLCGYIKRGEKIDPVGHHSWSNWIITRDATTKKRAVLTRSCSRCGASEKKDGDYAGPDYELVADKKKVNFDFTFGDRVQTVLVNYESKGRDQVTSINGFYDGSQKALYKLTPVGTNHVGVVPNVMQMVYTTKTTKTGTKSTIKLKGINGTNDAYAATSVSMNANIKYPSEKYTLTPVGAKICLWNEDLREWGTKTYSTAQLTAGSIFKLIPDDSDEFGSWLIKDDASKTEADWLNYKGWTYTRAAEFIMPPNDLTVEAKGAEKIKNIDVSGIKLPIANQQPMTDGDIVIDPGAPYELQYIEIMDSHNKAIKNPGPYESGQKYRVLVMLHAKDGYRFVFNGCYGLEQFDSVTFNGQKSLVDGGNSGALSTKSLVLRTRAITAGYPSGVAGTIEWSFNPETKTMTLGGTGPFAIEENMGEAFYDELSDYLDETETLIVGGKINYIGEFVMQDRNNLKKVVLGNHVIFVADSAFEDCDHLAEVELGPFVEEIGSYAFSCTALKKIDLKNVLYIADNAFYGCRELKEVKLSSYVKTIEKEAFEDCALTGVTLSGGVEMIGNYAFGYTYQNGKHKPVGGFTVTAPSDTEGHRYAKANGFSFVSTGSGTGDLLWSFDAYTNTLTFTGDGKMADYNSVEETPWYRYKDSIHRIDFVNSPTHIGAHAFEGLPLTGSLMLPYTVQKVGDYAFAGCTGIENTLDVPAKYIGLHAFESCTGITSVNLTNAVLINESAFANCSAIYDIQLGPELLSIGNRAFMNCSAYNNGIMIPSSVEMIGESAFEGCRQMWEVMFSEGCKLRTIGARAFKDCGIGMLTIPDTVTEIGDYAFYNNQTLSTVNPGMNIENIGDYAFANTDFNTIMIHGAIKSIGGHAFGYKTSGETDYPLSYFCIYGVSGTAAETYITESGEQGFEFIANDANEGLSGDCIWWFTGDMDPRDVNTLFIKGEGAMADYAKPQDAPWYHLEGPNVQIKEGVTYIGSNSFVGFRSLGLPESVSGIGEKALGFNSDGTPTEGFLLYGYSGTAAEEYAKRYDHIRFMDIRPEPYNPDSGWGIDYKWAFDQETGTLTFTSTAAQNAEIEDCTFGANAPWNTTGGGICAPWGYLKDRVTKVVIGDHIKSIGAYAFEFFTELKEIELGADVAVIGTGAFYNTGLGYLLVENPDCQLHSYCFGTGDEPHDEGAGGWSLYYPTGHPAICGHKGSGAESYANWYNDNAGKYGGHMSFVDITQQELSDTTTGISVATTEQGAKLSITAIDSGSIGVQLNGEIVSAYDISLKKGGQTIQPTDAVIVRIPCGDADAKVFRKEQNGSLTDMKAVYENGYLVFTTDHFSLYIIALSTEKPRLIGDVDGDGQVTLVDATYIQWKLASMKVPATFSDAAADIDGDNELSISDATYILRWIAYIDIPYIVGYETDR